MLNKSSTLRFRRLEIEEARGILSDGFVSAIGHSDTAAVLSSQLGLPVAHNRVNVSIEDADVLVIAQLTGGRLPEGAKTLPEGMRIEYWEVKDLDIRDELMGRAEHLEQVARESGGKPGTPSLIDDPAGPVQTLLEQAAFLRKLAGQISDLKKG